MSRVASLGMYDMDWLRQANDALWAGVAGRLAAAGMTDVPERLDRARPLSEIWRDPALILAQTCGYPLATALAEAVTPVAAPVYRWPGCEGARHRSVVVVRAGAGLESLADLSGRRAALNGADSNSGMNLFRHRIAPLSRNGRFFAGVVVTGSHVASLEAVSAGRADAAAIDCVTFGLVKHHRPERVAGLRIIAETALSPALPFVTRAGASAREIALLRQALAEALADPTLAGAAEALGLCGVEPVTLDDYAVVLKYEREAQAAGYPVLA
ncbi:phosphate/phosphite/phosphonate ABC transporter substrate-binding protein [Jiella sonneratiae]|uniref:PhnD/SsuA/transferrin family substrate-binding protein n=1 Tax=Jiella sonneratiae TaxID=2816856 RepID=A0ABS3IZ98_9HYPH|nr:PhnD/SsuA/transferrin family substrate-binding protein [Jiella sonneratiae]MBO0902745.1 PhnD/SsuA/transferrin family substrate-binding protein [Jiella sonneratiae]